MVLRKHSERRQSCSRYHIMLRYPDIDWPVYIIMMDSDVPVSIRWTLISTVPQKAVKFNHSLTVSVKPIETSSEWNFYWNSHLFHWQKGIWRFCVWNVRSHLVLLLMCQQGSSCCWTLIHCGFMMHSSVKHHHWFRYNGLMPNRYQAKSKPTMICHQWDQVEEMSMEIQQKLR